MSGRQKGNAAEREVAKMLATWWGKAEPLSPHGLPIEFVRTPLSGGWGGASTRAGFKASGDVMTTAARFPFCVEVKRRESWEFSWLASGRASPVWGWWRQTQDAANENHPPLVPMMWFRRNRTGWLVMLPARLRLKLTRAGMTLPLLEWPNDLCPRVPAMVGNEPAMVVAGIDVLRIDSKRLLGLC